MFQCASLSMRPRNQQLDNAKGWQQQINAIQFVWQHSAAAPLSICTAHLLAVCSRNSCLCRVLRLAPMTASCQIVQEYMADPALLWCLCRRVCRRTGGRGVPHHPTGTAASPRQQPQIAPTYWPGGCAVHCRAAVPAAACSVHHKCGSDCCCPR